MWTLPELSYHTSFVHAFQLSHPCHYPVNQLSTYISTICSNSFLIYPLIRNKIVFAIKLFDYYGHILVGLKVSIHRVYPYYSHLPYICMYEARAVFSNIIKCMHVVFGYKCISLHALINEEFFLSHAWSAKHTNVNAIRHATTDAEITSLSTHQRNVQHDMRGVPTSATKK